MIDKLRELNNKLINANKDNPDVLKKQNLIHEMLEYDDLFFRIKIEEAYGILRDLGIKEEDIKNMYLDLIDKKNF